ncbi:hypothetical protein WJX79_000229 [Trebouxia sp. C0005]
MPQVEDDVPLANLVATSSGHSNPDQGAAPTSKANQATPTAAPATRQLRHTRSQSARKAPSAFGSTDAKAKQAAEGEELEGVAKQDQPVESQQESAAAAVTEPDAAVQDTSAAMSIQLDPSKEDVSISELSEGNHQQASQAAKGNSQLYKGKSDASQASGPHASLKSQTSKADSLTLTQPDDLKVSGVDEPKASKLEESRASQMEEPRTSGLEEPPAKRPRRAAATNAGQKEPKELSNGKAKEGNNGKAKRVITGKANGRRAQAKRGVVQEPDTGDTDDTDDVDIVDQEEDVDIGTNDQPYEQSVPAEDMEVDEKPQAQAGKKRPRKPEELPSGKGRPKPGPSTAKGPGLGAAKAGKDSAEGSEPAAKTGKGSSAAPVPTRAGPKEKRPSSGKHEASQAATNASTGDIAKQAAEVQKGLLKDAMKGFDEARQAFEVARQALAQAADQVETSLSSIGQLSGLTMDILRDTLLGKDVSKLNKLARLHPTITDCERISSKASEVTAILKRAVGLPTQGPGQPPQGQAQQPKKPGAAVALEAAVFAHFAEHGEPGMRYKRRLHALWSYLRGTDQAPAVSQLRQKVLQGEILTKTLAKIDRAQAQHLWRCLQMILYYFAIELHVTVDRSYKQTVSSKAFAFTAYANARQTFLLSRTQRCGCKERLASAKAVQAPRNNTQRPVITARSIKAAAVEAPPKIEVIKKDTVEVLKDFTAFDLDQYTAGGSKSWTFWNCEPSTFPWEYGSVEHAYILQGKFSVQYEGAEPVTIEAGDFVSFH